MARLNRHSRTSPGSDDTELLRRRRDDDIQSPVLRVVAGIDVVRFHTVLVGEEVLIGRDEDTCGLALNDVAVSRKHARVWNDNGTVWLEDLKSMNGTRCDGKPVHGSVKLQKGAQIKIGGMTIRLDVSSAEEVSTLERLARRVMDSSIDLVTGLRTRRAFEEDAAVAVHRSHTRGAPVSAIFLDIDHFKMINDSFGHSVGDEVLRIVGSQLREGIRDTDYALRWGGEEFVLVLPGCAQTDAVLIAERALTKVKHFPWSSVTPLGSPRPLAVTLSGGVAMYHGDIDDWIDRADKAMYQAKQDGRDRIAAAHP